MDMDHCVACGIAWVDETLHASRCLVGQSALQSAITVHNTVPSDEIEAMLWSSFTEALREEILSNASIVQNEEST